jgi:hypothetical protein
MRRDLGLEVKPEKVSLAQNFCLTKINVRGKVRESVGLLLRSY